MTQKNTIDAINLRYSELAEGQCCLSCGGALNHANPKPGNVCVDLGSGRGTDVLRLAEIVGETGRVYGIDISDGMLEKARATAQKLGVTNVEFLQSQLEDLALPRNSVDVVISNCTINHSQNKAKVWREIYRILRTGGSFTVSDIYAVEPIAAEYRNDPQAVAECWAGAVTKDEYLQTLEDAGFIRVRVLEESKPYAKGKAVVASFTITGLKPSELYSCCG